MKCSSLAICLFFCFFVAGGAASGLLAQRVVHQLNGREMSPEKIDALVTNLMEAGHVDGLCISILNGGEPVYTKAYGYKNKDLGQKLDTNTVMYAASFSKAVFGFLMAKLVEKGVIDLDRPLFEYLPQPLPDYPYYSSLRDDDRWKLFTARMCLAHTTGLPNIWWLDPHTGAVDTTEKLQIYFTPGSRYAYSGEGLKLLQLVVEKITGKSLEVLAREAVFDPLGMKNTSYIWQDAFQNNLAAGHTEDGKALYKGKATKPGAAGSMFTTIADYSRFISCVMKGTGLTREAEQEMLRPQIAIHSKYQFPTITGETTKANNKISLSYGLGWGLMKTGYGPAFFKEGHDDNWRNYNINFPAKGISLIIMSNSANGEGIFKELLQKLIGDRFTPWQWQRYIPYNKLGKSSS